MARRLLNQLTGVGAVYAGDQRLRETAYTLSIWSDDGESRRPGEMQGRVTIDGHIDITGIGEAIVLAGPDGLTLVLEDRRRLAFTLTDTGGTIVGRGGLEPA